MLLPLFFFHASLAPSTFKQLNLRQSRSPSLASARSGLSHDSFKVKQKSPNFLGIKDSLIFVTSSFISTFSVATKLTHVTHMWYVTHITHVTHYKIKTQPSAFFAFATWLQRPTKQVYYAFIKVFSYFIKFHYVFNEYLK